MAKGSADRKSSVDMDAALVTTAVRLPPPSHLLFPLVLAAAALPPCGLPNVEAEWDQEQELDQGLAPPFPTRRPTPVLLLLLVSED